MKNALRLAALTLGLLAAPGCGSGDSKPDDLTTTPLGAYDMEKARLDLKLMLEKLEADDAHIAALQRAYDDLLKDPEVVRAMKDRGFSALCASVTGGGGLLIRFGGGSGRVCFAGGRQATLIDISGWRVGATVGGEKTYAVGIVVGLKQEAEFVGDYNVGVKGGVAGDMGTASGTAQPKKGTHTIYFVGSSVGFSGDASGGGVSISWATPEPPPK